MTDEPTGPNDALAAGGRCCPICGGDRFVEGPKGRRSPNGLLPRCATCGALERHRAFRTAFDALASVFAHRTALQFSDDPSVPREPFARFEVSQYGGANHLDMAAIARPDASYDVVIANHVLEHVEDDHAALQELARVAGPDGLVILSVPDLLRAEASVEYGRAREDKHGHFRIYGPDIASRWTAAVPAWRGLGLTPADPVTEEPDRLTLLSRDASTLKACERVLLQHGFAPFDAFGAAAEAAPAAR